MTTSAELESRLSRHNDAKLGSFSPTDIADLWATARDSISALRTAEEELARVNAALVEFNAGMQKIGGCTDGGCRIIKPTGMHTNGGCRCFRNEIKMQHYIHFTQRLVAAIKEHPHV